MTLHILNQARDLNRCLSLAGSGDSILLIEAAAEAAEESLTDHGEVTVPVYALMNDLSTHKRAAARGIIAIDWDGMVDLCCRHNPVLSW